MKKKLLTFFILLFSLSVHAQTKTDSTKVDTAWLKAEIKSMEKVETLLKEKLEILQAQMQVSDSILFVIDKQKTLWQEEINTMKKKVTELESIKNKTKEQNDKLSNYKKLISGMTNKLNEKEEKLQEIVRDHEESVQDLKEAENLLKELRNKMQELRRMLEK